MKALLCYQNQSITVEINDTLGHLSVLCDMVYRDKYNTNFINNAVAHVEEQYIEIAKKLFNTNINHASFTWISNPDDEIIDTVTFDIR